MEEYANAGFRQMSEIVEDNPNYLYKEGAFLDLFVPFITVPDSDEVDGPESLD